MSNLKDFFGGGGCCSPVDGHDNELSFLVKKHNDVTVPLGFTAENDEKIYCQILFVAYSGVSAKFKLSKNNSHSIVLWRGSSNYYLTISWDTNSNELTISSTDTYTSDVILRVWEEG